MNETETSPQHHRTRKNNISRTQRIETFRAWLSEMKMPYPEGSFLAESPNYRYKRKEK